MGLYAQLADVKIIMRASSRERIRFSDDAFRVWSVGEIQNVTIGSIRNQSKAPEPVYTMSIRKDQALIADSYKGRDMVNFVFIDANNYNVYTQEFKDNSYDKRELYHGSGSISTTYDYNGEISFPPAFWVGIAEPNFSVKIQFECDISTQDAEFFIGQAEIALDNMLSAAAVDYLLPGESRLFIAPDIPPVITMAAQYLAAYYIYTNVYAEQLTDGKSGHFTDRWRKMCMEVLNDFSIWKNRLPPSVVQRICWQGNFAERVKDYFDTPIVCLRQLQLDAECSCGSC